MSAGGLSYSGITNYGCVTLPSVEAGLGSMNILRDPPKSIMTRRIDKVGETSSITEMIDESDNRACEAISVYARGVNPMVSVSYGNAGNNGGQRVQGCGIGGSDRGSSGNAIHGGQAYLPYRIMPGGAFRPPIIRQEQLMPLSRQPRTNTEAFTQPGFADFTKKLRCPGKETRHVKEDTLRACIRPTATYRLDAPLVEPFEVKYVIKNPTKFAVGAGNSGFRTQDLTTQQVLEPTKEVNTTPLHMDVYANQSGATVRYVDQSHFNTDKYTQNTLHSNVQSKKSQSIMVGNIEDAIDIQIDGYLQDALHSNVQSNKNQNIQVTPIEDIMDVDIHTKDNFNISYTAPFSGNTKEEHMHDDLELRRRVVLANAATNKQRNIYSRPAIQHQAVQKRNRPIAHATANRGVTGRQSINDLNSREYRLKPTINAGGMTGRGQLPMQGRNHQINPNVESEKMAMSRKVMEMQTGRFMH